MKIQLVVKINLTECFVKELPNNFFLPNNTYIKLPNGKMSFIENIELNSIRETLIYSMFLQSEFINSETERKKWLEHGFVYQKLI